MTWALLQVAADVIARASRERAADRVLRETLKSRRSPDPADAAQISRAVFAYYRWRGWLDEHVPLPRRLEHATALAERFAVSPSSFPNAELVARVVPKWVHDELELTPVMARALQNEPKVWLRARPGQGRALAKQLGNCRNFGQGALEDSLEYTGKRDLLLTAEFHAGQFELQDLNSQAVGLICSPQPGQTWWDACAGEGGKLLHLSDLMQNEGLIWASDRAAWRMAVLKRRAARAHVFNYRAAAWDGGARLPTRTKFDGVLIDAPCSGIGTWHRNPHARWTTTPQDVKELAQVQLRLLQNARVALKPGGKLIYSVCTLARSETTEVARRFLEKTPEFRPLQINNPFDRRQNATGELLLQLEANCGNGMYIGAWTKS